MPSYTPEHRRAVLKGLRILARVRPGPMFHRTAARWRADERTTNPDLLLSL